MEQWNLWLNRITWTNGPHMMYFINILQRGRVFSGIFPSDSPVFVSLSVSDPSMPTQTLFKSTHGSGSEYDNVVATSAGLECFQPIGIVSG